MGVAYEVDVLNTLSDDFVGKRHGIPGDCKTANGNLGAVLDKTPDSVFEGHQLVIYFRIHSHY